MCIKDIPRLSARLNCWFFKLKFAQEVATIRPDIESITLASEEIINSKKFKELLSIILAITNFLNANSSKKDTYGFKLSSLQKLKDTRTADGKSDLLQYIALFCEKKYPHLLRVEEELPHLEPATRVALPEMISEINQMKAGISQVEKEIKFAENANLQNDVFPKQMSEFLSTGKEELERINDALGVMNDNLRKMAEVSFFFKIV